MRPATLHGLDDDAVRFLEVHETHAHALGGRTVRDLGDCVLLHDPLSADTFYNRIGAIRWPDAAGAFDHRLAEAIALFGGLDRRPSLWTPPAFRQPADIEARLRSHGFREGNGGFFMAAGPRLEASGSARDSARGGARLVPGRGDGVIERIGGGPIPAGSPERQATPADLGELAALLCRAFGILEADGLGVQADLAASLASPAFHLVVVRADGRPVAIGKRFTVDGASYLASIGTDPRAAGRGYGTLVTSTLLADSLAAGSHLVHLGVHADNDRAIEVYRRVGFVVIGERARDFVLR